MTTVDLYLRLSIDREGKDSLERQEADLREWAVRSGLTVRKVWKDGSKSGYKKQVVREQFDAAVSAVTKGEVSTLAVWKLDRLSRRGAGQVGLLLDQLEEVGGRLYFYQDHLDSSDSNHRTLIVLVSEQARTESANTSLRVRAKIASDAAAGLPKGGVRSFGWETDGVTLRKEESDLIKRAVADYLEGTRSMLHIARDWTEAGVITDGMKRSRKGRDGEVRKAREVWTATTVRQLLLRERNAGHLTHQGERMPKSQITPIITVEQLEQLKARVKLGTPVGARAQTLLGGILRCECGAAMHGTQGVTKRRTGKRYVYDLYRCADTLYNREQKHSSIQRKVVDDLVFALITSDLFQGLITTPEEKETKGALERLTEALRANEEDRAHASSILRDRSLSSLHAETRADLKLIDAQRQELQIQREALLSQMREDGGLSAFMRAWEEEDVDSFTSKDDFEQWGVRFQQAWDSIDLERRQGLIKARYRPVVKAGGRGIERIVMNPVVAKSAKRRA